MDTVKFVTFSNLMIDDIVLSDGRTYMNTLGGTGTYTLFGMRIWTDGLGFVAAVGTDLDPTHRATLAHFGIDLRGLIECEGYSTARAWQLYEPDDRRVMIFRTERPEFIRYKPGFEDIPADYLYARGFHLQWGSLEDLGLLIADLHAVNPNLRLVSEPWSTQRKQPRAAFEATLCLIDFFSPNLVEAQQITDREEPLAVVDTLLDWGAPGVVLRMGAQGSLVATAAGMGWHVPAVPTRIVDVTGAGSSYCGAFLTGICTGLDPLEAALRGAVSASFTIEQFGLPTLDETFPAEAARRQDWARERSKPLKGFSGD
jgi:sugar/nucleoside kinase (ribokinase family)